MSSYDVDSPRIATMPKTTYEVAVSFPVDIVPTVPWRGARFRRSRRDSCRDLRLVLDNIGVGELTDAGEQTREHLPFEAGVMLGGKVE